MGADPPVARRRARPNQAGGGAVGSGSRSPGASARGETGPNGRPRAGCWPPVGAAGGCFQGAGRLRETRRLTHTRQRRRRERCGPRLTRRSRERGLVRGGWRALGRWAGPLIDVQASPNPGRQRDRGARLEAAAGAKGPRIAARIVERGPVGGNWTGSVKKMPGEVDSAVVVYDNVNYQHATLRGGTPRPAKQGRRPSTQRTAASDPTLTRARRLRQASGAPRARR